MGGLCPALPAHRLMVPEEAEGLFTRRLAGTYFHPNIHSNTFVVSDQVDGETLSCFGKALSDEHGFE